MRTLAAAAACLAALTLVACGDTQHATTGAALTVNGHAVSTQSYDAAVQSLRGRLEQRTGHAVATNTAAGARQLASLEAAAIRELVAQQVVEQMAAQRHVSVGDSDVAATLASLQSSAGGEDQIIVALGGSGLSDADVHAAIRLMLLQQRLRAADPTGYDGAFAAAVRDAKVTVNAAPCTTTHAYPACVQGL